MIEQTIKNRQILEITTSKSKEEIIYVLNNLFAEINFSIIDDIFCWNVLEDKMMYGNKTYLKFFVSDYRLIVVGWVKTGKKEFILGDNIDIKNFVCSIEEKKRTGSFSAQLAEIVKVVEDENSIIKCYAVAEENINDSLGTIFIPDVIEKKKDKNVLTEIILDIISIPLCFISPIISACLCIFALINMYKYSSFKNMGISNKFIYILNIILIVLYIIVAVIPTITSIINA